MTIDDIKKELRYPLIHQVRYRLAMRRELEEARVIQAIINERLSWLNDNTDIDLSTLTLDDLGEVGLTHSAQPDLLEGANK
jgi:hypothetical protein